jgi:hypothetical protein
VHSEEEGRKNKRENKRAQEMEKEKPSYKNGNSWPQPSPLYNRLINFLPAPASLRRSIQLLISTALTWDRISFMFVSRLKVKHIHQVSLST